MSKEKENEQLKVKRWKNPFLVFKMALLSSRVSGKKERGAREKRFVVEIKGERTLDVDPNERRCSSMASRERVYLGLRRKIKLKGKMCFERQTKWWTLFWVSFIRGGSALERWWCWEENDGKDIKAKKRKKEHYYLE